MDNIPSWRFHFVSFGDYLTIFLCSVFIESLVLILPEDYALKERSDLVFGEIVGKFTHLVQEVNIFIQYQW